jgi:hypothetical protein
MRSFEFRADIRKDEPWHIADKERAAIKHGDDKNRSATVHVAVKDSWAICRAWYRKGQVGHRAGS